MGILTYIPTPFLDVDGNNITIISNIYKNGKGIIKVEKNCYGINYQTLSECASLTIVSIPDSVTSIGNNAFNGCYSMTAEAETPLILDPNVFDYIASNTVIYAPSGSVSTYKSTTKWSSYVDNIRAIS